MRKIMHIFSKMDRGGAELRTIEIMKEMKGEFEFHICSTSGKKGELDEMLKEIGIQVHYINIKKIDFPLKFIKILKKNKISIVHSHILFVSGMIQLFAKIAGVKNRITHFRTSRDNKEKNNKLRSIRNKILKNLVEIFSTNILYVSEIANESLFPKKRFPKKHKTIYNGFDLPDKDKFPKKEKNNFVYVARFYPTKNQMFLLDVIEILKERFKINIVISFIGNIETEYGKEFIRRVQSKKLEDYINIIGEVSNPLDYLEASEYFLFPSKLEGLSGALIEAHIQKCVVISSNINENKEVNQYFSGSSFSLKLDPHVWANKINDLIAARELISFSEKNPFDIKITTKELTKIYINSI
ncbi:glycosyltransferase [Staphylococcus equorum]|uniref:glycosyltransferase n=1 Tax=Staphylococcus equorum TaxID=246432 RepID=UPI002555D98B|nr:glycosyltransferase [Staphylococcus equorum]MDK9855708.1 glycosyltransferase [Staphylococcus equorum]